jgi:uncharacterized membrane protein YbhN (UPF0104 family)
MVGLVGLLIRNWHKIQIKALEALHLIEAARPGWLVLAALAVLAGFLCAGQIYGRVLATLGHRAPSLWLSAAALVTMLLSQALPVGTVASYAFLTTSLRHQRGGDRQPRAAQLGRRNADPVCLRDGVRAADHQ